MEHNSVCGETAQTGVVCSPPPVAPKKFSAKRIPGGKDTPDGSLEIVKTGVVCSPPPVAPKKFSAKRIPGGKDTPDGSLEIVKTSDTDQNKQLVVRLPLGTTAVYEEPTSLPPAYDRCLIRATKRTVTIRHGKHDDTNPPIYERIYEEEKTYMVHLPTYNQMQPPPLPVKPPVKGKVHKARQNEILITSPPPVYESILSEEETGMDANYLMNWWKEVKSWDYLLEDLKLKEKEERKIVTVKAGRVYTAIQLYNLLLTVHGHTLRDHVVDLLSIAENLDKVSKGTKIAGITGGATSIVGGLAAAAGVILVPFTLGASLALTVVGVGVAVTGGVTGASAAIARKVNTEQDKRKIEKIFQEYTALMADIDGCLKFINEGLEQLQQHSPSVLERVTKSVRIARVAELMAGSRAGARAIEANSTASDVLRGFALGMDMYFTKGKHGQKLRKGLKSKFAEKIRTVAAEMNNGLDELMRTKGLLS